MFFGRSDKTHVIKYIQAISLFKSNIIDNGKRSEAELKQSYLGRSEHSVIKSQ